MSVVDLQSKLMQTESTFYIRTDVRVVLSYKSFGQKSHNHCYTKTTEKYIAVNSLVSNISYV